MEIPVNRRPVVLFSALVGVAVLGVAFVFWWMELRAWSAAFFGFALLDLEILGVWLAHAAVPPRGPGWSDAKALRSQIEHEDILVNNRLGWLTTLQGLLFAGYAVLSTQDAQGASSAPHGAFGVAGQLHVFAWAGLVSTVVVACSIVAALAAIERLTMAHEIPHKAGQDSAFSVHQTDPTLVCVESHPSLTSSAPIHVLGLAAPLLLPVLLAAVWILVLFYR